VLISHRRHALPSEAVTLELDRVVFPDWVFRRAYVEGVIQDERLTTSVLGRGAPSERSRLVVSLEGSVTVFALGRVVELGAGEALIARRLDDLTIRAGAGHSFEMDWAPTGELAASTCGELDHAKLGKTTLAAIADMSRAMREAATATVPILLDAAEAATQALRFEGLPFDARAIREPRAALACPGMQQLTDALDTELSELHLGPALGTVEDRLGCSRRTVARRIREVHARYGISALTGADWRSARDFYRLLLGTILASHPAVTTNRLARMLGYSSPAALCHAFANAGLPSPTALGELARNAA